MQLEPPDSHHLNAAIGWLGLGNRKEAVAELQHISAEKQSHPDVLELRFAIFADEQRWDSALTIARWLVECAPNRSSGWLHQAYALRRVPYGGLEKAWDALQPAAIKFPEEPTIPYNLACYACQLQRLDEARDWFRRALKAGDRTAIKQMALADPDLQPLWDEIEQL